MDIPLAKKVLGEVEPSTKKCVFLCEEIQVDLTPPSFHDLVNNPGIFFSKKHLVIYLQDTLKNIGVAHLKETFKVGSKVTRFGADVFGSFRPMIWKVANPKVAKDTNSLWLPRTLRKWLAILSWNFWEGTVGQM